MKNLIAATRAALKVFHIRRTGEPIFVLRARDAIAEKCVRDWAARVQLAWGERPCGNLISYPKVVGAAEIADAMRAWPTKKLPY